MYNIRSDKVDGTGDDKNAPRPRWGLIQAVYDTVGACGGANFSQVREYLPAAITSSTQIVTKRRLEKILYNAVYHGYLIHDATGITAKGYWKIAPLSYFNARHSIIKDLKAQREKTGKSRKQRAEEKVIDAFGNEAATVDPTLLIIVGIGALILGFLLGFMLGKLM